MNWSTANIRCTGSQGQVDPEEEGAVDGAEVQGGGAAAARRLRLLRPRAAAGLELRGRHARVPGELHYTALCLCRLTAHGVFEGSIGLAPPNNRSERKTPTPWVS